MWKNPSYSTPVELKFVFPSNLVKSGRRCEMPFERAPFTRSELQAVTAK